MDDNKDTLSGAIMNIKCQPTYEAHIPRVAYREGHRDARHAAAELVSEFAAQAEQSQSAGSARQGGITSIDHDEFWRHVMAYCRGTGNEGKALVDYVNSWLAAAIASQSQAAQPTEAVEQIMTLAHSWAMAAYKKALNLTFEDIDAIRKQLRDSAAHIAGTSQATKAQAEPIYEEDLLDIVRTFCNIAQRMTELTPAQRENYPSPLSPSSPILIVAQNACIERGYTEWGLAIEGVEYPVASVAKEAEKEQQGPVVRAWLDAEKASREAIEAYNEAVRESDKYIWPGTDINAEFQIMSQAKNKAFHAMHAMYDALIAPTTQQAAKAESEQAEGEQAHVMPPMRGTGIQRFSDALATLQSAIMNLPCERTMSHFATQRDMENYKEGRLDARVAAAELVIEAERRFRAQGGNTNTNDSNSAATPTTSTVSAPAEQFDFHAHLARQAAWSEKTFGPGMRTKGVCDHIRKELLEIEADPSDLREWIDVVILGLDGAWRCGGTPEQIIGGIVAKQTKNEGRNWPDWRTADPDKAIEHDRSTDQANADTGSAE